MFWLQITTEPFALSHYSVFDYTCFTYEEEDPYTEDWIYTLFTLITTHAHISAVKQFGSLQITASVLFVYFFIKAYVVGIHLILHQLVDAIQMIPTTYAIKKKISKRKHKNIA